MAAGEKLRYLEGLRGLTALYVVLGHLCSMADPNALSGKESDSPWWLQVLMYPLSFGHLAVAAFIVISGFCLEISVLNHPKMDGRLFFKRRAIRILPPYYACLAISIAVAAWITPLGQGMPFAIYLPLTQENVLAHLGMIHNLSPDWMYKINGVLWSIAIECQLYLLFPFLVYILVRHGRGAVVAAAGSLSFLALLAVPTSMKLYPWYLGLFALGMAAAHLAYRPPRWRGPSASAAMLVSFVSACLCVAACQFRAALPVRDAWLGVALVGLLYAGAVSPRTRLIRWLGWQPLVGLGTISYSLYLMHHPIQQPIFIFRPDFVQGSTLQLTYLFAVGLPTILLGSGLFWLAFERPFMPRRQSAPPDRFSRVPISLPLRSAGKRAPSRPKPRERVGAR